MANRNRGLEDFLDFASTPAWRSAVLFAAVSFALLHLVVLVTPPLDLNAGADTVVPLQMVNMTAQFLRFAIPTGCLVSNFSTFVKARKAQAHFQR
jgi:hypothetical protein